LEQEFDRDLILNKILDEFEQIPMLLKNENVNASNLTYQQNLYGYNTTTQFKLHEKIIPGKIRQVDISGSITIEFEDGTLKRFDHSEIQQLY
jgi:biotin-(acetyl-CoA carboxylase) ligase